MIKSPNDSIKKRFSEFLIKIIDYFDENKKESKSYIVFLTFLFRFLGLFLKNENKIEVLKVHGKYFMRVFQKILHSFLLFNLREEEENDLILKLFDFVLRRLMVLDLFERSIDDKNELIEGYFAILTIFASFIDDLKFQLIQKDEIMSKIINDYLFKIASSN